MGKKEERRNQRVARALERQHQLSSNQENGPRTPSTEPPFLVIAALDIHQWQPIALRSSDTKHVYILTDNLQPITIPLPTKWFEGVIPDFKEFQEQLTPVWNSALQSGSLRLSEVPFRDLRLGMIFADSIQTFPSGEPDLHHTKLYYLMHGRNRPPDDL